MPTSRHKLLVSYSTPLLWLAAVALLIAAGWRLHSQSANASSASRLPPQDVIPHSSSDVTLPITVRIYDVYDLVDRWLASPYLMSSTQIHGTDPIIVHKRTEELMGTLRQTITQTDCIARNVGPTMAELTTFSWLELI